MNFRTTGLALGVLLCLGAAPASAQEATGSRAAAVQRVDGAFVRANAAKTPDWPDMVESTVL